MLRVIYSIILNSKKIILYLFYVIYNTIHVGRRGGLMVSTLVPGARGHCVVFLGKTLNSHSASSTQVYKWVPVNCRGNLTNCGGMTCDGLASCPCLLLALYSIQSILK